MKGVADEGDCMTLHHAVPYFFDALELVHKDLIPAEAQFKFEELRKFPLMRWPFNDVPSPQPSPAPMMLEPVDDGCPSDCDVFLISDEECDEACNVPACNNFDGGACPQAQGACQWRCVPVAVSAPKHNHQHL